MYDHTPDQVKAFDRFKLIVLLILVALLLLLLCNVLRPPAAQAPTPTAAPPTAQPVTPTQAPPPTAVLVAPTVRAEAKDGKLALNGTGTPGSTVQVVLDGKVVGTAPVGADGKWSLTVDVAPGEHEIIANTLDAAGKVVAAAPPLKLSITAPITAPTLDKPASATGPLNLTGTGTPGSTVQVVVDGKVVGTAPVGADGKWSFKLDIAPGEHEIIANALDAGGKVVVAAPPLKLSIAAPITAPTLDKPASAVGPLNLTGTGTPGSTVQVVVDGKVIGTAPVGADGKWSFKLDLAAGAREIVVNALDAAGKVVVAAPPLKLSIAAPITAPTLDKPASAVGPLNLTGTGTPGSTVQVVVDGKVIGTAPIGADGKWSFKLDLAAGAREIVVNALDAAGKVVAAAASFKLGSATPSVLPAAGASGLGRAMVGLSLLMLGCALVMKGYAESTQRPDA